MKIKPFTNITVINKRWNIDRTIQVAHIRCRDTGQEKEIRVGHGLQHEKNYK